MILSKKAKSFFYLDRIIKDVKKKYFNFIAIFFVVILLFFFKDIIFLFKKTILKDIYVFANYLWNQIEDNKKANFLLELSKFIFTIIGSFILYLNFLVASGNKKISEKKLDSERFYQSVNQLDSESLSVRIGAIYSLERISEESKRDFDIVIKLLSSRLKEIQHKYKNQVSAQSSSSENKQNLLLELMTIFRVIEARKRHISNEKIDRRNMNFQNDIFKNCQFDLLNLTGSDFNNCNLLKSNFSNSNLTDANFTDANLEGVNFSKANLRGAKFNNAVLVKAIFDSAILHGADLSNANLSDANLKKAELYNAKLTNADLAGTDFAGTEGLTDEQLRNTKNYQNRDN